MQKEDILYSRIYLINFFFIVDSTKENEITNTEEHADSLIKMSQSESVVNTTSNGRKFSKDNLIQIIRSNSIDLFPTVYQVEETIKNDE